MMGSDQVHTNVEATLPESGRTSRTMRLATMPGTLYDPKATVHPTEEGQVFLLWSRWGVEGIYTDPAIMANQYAALKGLLAYIDEPLTYEVRYLNQVN